MLMLGWETSWVPYESCFEFHDEKGWNIKVIKICELFLGHLENLFKKLTEYKQSPYTHSDNTVKYL